MPSLSSFFFRLMMRRLNIFRAPGGSLEALRRRTESSARFMKVPKNVKVQVVWAGSVPAEWLFPDGAPQDRALLYIHGGAWVFCSPATHRAMVAQLALAAGVKALSIDYRLAPEHPFPAGLDDCVAAYCWLIQSGIAPQKIVIGGDSAGGNLTLATLLALKDRGDPPPAGAVCLSPATDLASTGESVRTKAAVDPVLRHATGSNIHLNYVGCHDVLDPLISPLYGDLRGMPPILIHVGEDEILLDDATRFAERARAARVDARVVVWPHMWHVFQMHAPVMPEARESIRQLGKFIKEVLA